MNDRTPFDDLARRKLAERDFPFAPEAWADMEQQIDALPPRRDRRPFILMALLLLIGGGIWYGIPSRQDAAVQAAQMDKPDAARARNEVLHAQEPFPMIATSIDTAVPAGASRIAPAEGMDPPVPSIDRPEPVTPPARPSASTNEQAAQPVPSAGTTPAVPAVKIAPVVIPAVQDDAPSSTTGHATTDEPKTTRSAAPKDGPADPTPFDRTPAGITLPAVVTTPGHDDSDPQAPETKRPATHAPLTLAPEPHNDPSPVAGEPSAAPPLDPVAEQHGSLPPVVDSTLITVTDTNTWAPPSPPFLEATVWGGLFNTATMYTGSRTHDWATSHAGRTAMGLGAELMRMGRRFGIGAGLHFSTYAEDMNAQSLSDTWTELVQYHHVEGIDTTIMIVNGTTVINGQTYHVTQTLDTTILVLVTSTGEETFSQVQRNELHRTNRTSYLEVPLLLDAHTAAGRWHFGVRGGPMLGVLQGRRGVLPGAQGYTDMQNEAFSELVVGWTAQGYIRYRVAGGWLIGLGPSARGQLFNTMQGDALVRRSSAWGGQFSVSYLLP